MRYSSETRSPPIACSDSTHEKAGLCVPNAEGFIVISTADSVPADGKTTLALFAIGAQADGTPALDPLVFTVTPATAGTISADPSELTKFGFAASFTPCDSTAADCKPGAFQVNVAKKSDPTTVLATSQSIQLTAPAPAPKS